MRMVRVSPMILAVLSLVGCLGFMRFYLDRSAEHFAKDFQQQNFLELSHGDTSSLILRLNSMSGSVHWICISAKRHGEIFFEKAKSSCNAGPFKKQILLPSLAGGGVELDFTITLPPELVGAGVAFGLSQCLILIFLAWTSRLNERIRLAGEIRLGRLAAQVAHDIRSPLAALRVAVHHSESISEEARELVRSAMVRIQSIASDLLKVHRDSLAPGKSKAPEVTRVSVRDLHSGIQSILNEKRLLCRDTPDLIFNYQTSGNHSDAVVLLDLGELQRILSNLIDNSIEAMDRSGNIDLHVIITEDKISIEVKDQGSGMDQKTVAKLGQRGFTLGKKTGSGIGIYNAKMVVTSWGGRLGIHSVPGAGTSVTMTLPKL